MRSAWAAGALLVALAGCAQGDVSVPASGATSTPPPRVPARALTLTAAEGGTRLTAAATSAGSLVGTVAFRGTAIPHQALTVRAACSSGPCTVVVNPDAAGAFAGELRVRTTYRAPKVRLTAAYVDPGRAASTAAFTLTVAPAAVRTAAADARRARERRRTERAAAAAPRPSASPPAAVPAPVPATGTDPGSPSPSRGSGSLLVVGDSLAVGTRDGLARLLPRWSIRTDARIGRPLAEGMGRLRALVAEQQPDVAVLSLFTNDGPEATGALAASVRSAQGLARCTIWLTVVRPPYRGVSYAAANRTLRKLASDRVRIVDWAAAVAADPALVAPDGVHGTPAGYARRSALIVAAVEGCHST